MNELDKLRKMLDEAKIPYENYQKEFDDKLMLDFIEKNYSNIKEAKYMRNQIVYGLYGKSSWKFDGICQYGSYGVSEGMIESYGSLGTDENGEPMVLTAEEAFKIISEDYKT